MQRTKLKAPFGWVGGKTQLARDIIDLIPQEHKTYIEVFGGAGSVLYQKEPSKLEVFNDINSELINLHRAIRNNPQSLSIYLNDLLISREIFNDIKSKHLRGRNNIEKAAVNDELFIKQLIYQDNLFTLKSFNSDYKDINVKADELVVIGRVKGVLNKI